MSIRRMLVAPALLACAHVASSEALPADSLATTLQGSLTTTFLRESDSGSRVIEMRACDAWHALALGRLETETSFKLPGPQPPLSPRRPLAGSVPPEVTHVDFFQSNDFYERHTIYERTPDDSWVLTSDSTRATRPPECYAGLGSCDTLPSGWHGGFCS